MSGSPNVISRPRSQYHHLDSLSTLISGLNQGAVRLVTKDIKSRELSTTGIMCDAQPQSRDS